MEGPSPLDSLADGGMDELACRIVAADAHGLVDWGIGHSPAICLHESGILHSGHLFVGAWPNLMASLPLYSCPYMNLRREVHSHGLWVSFL